MLLFGDTYRVRSLPSDSTSFEDSDCSFASRERLGIQDRFARQFGVFQVERTMDLSSIGQVGSQTKLRYREQSGLIEKWLEHSLPYTSTVLRAQGASTLYGWHHSQNIHGRKRHKGGHAPKPRGYREVRPFFSVTVNMAIPSPEEVRPYLDTLPRLREFIPRLARALAETFEGNAILSLEVYRDRESDYEDLTLFVRMREYSVDVTRKIRDVKRRFADDFASVGYRVDVMTDFRRAP